MTINLELGNLWATTCHYSSYYHILSQIHDVTCFLIYILQDKLMNPTPREKKSHKSKSAIEERRVHNGFYTRQVHLYLLPPPHHLRTPSPIGGPRRMLNGNRRLYQQIQSFDTQNHSYCVHSCHKHDRSVFASCYSIDPGAESRTEPFCYCQVVCCRNHSRHGVHARVAGLLRHVVVTVLAGAALAQVSFLWLFGYVVCHSDSYGGLHGH